MGQGGSYASGAEELKLESPEERRRWTGGGQRAKGSAEKVEGQRLGLPLGEEQRGQLKKVAAMRHGHQVLAEPNGEILYIIKTL